MLHNVPRAAILSIALGHPCSQLVIYSGAFEIIELTHLSDGKSRNAKRSLGEKPAAPDKPFCLQTAQSLQPGRWGLCFHVSRSPCLQVFSSTTSLPGQPGLLVITHTIGISLLKNNSSIFSKQETRFLTDRSYPMLTTNFSIKRLVLTVVSMFLLLLQPSLPPETRGLV